MNRLPIGNTWLVAAHSLTNTGVAFDVVTCAERPDLELEAGDAFRERWPEFVFHDALVTAYMPRVDEYFAAYAIYLLNQGRVAAG